MENEFPSLDVRKRVRNAKLLDGYKSHYCSLFFMLYPLVLM